MFYQDRVEEALESNLEKRTKLEAWFDLNKQEYKEAQRLQALGKLPQKNARGELEYDYDGELAQPYIWPCKNLPYIEIPNYYTWPSKEIGWKKRERLPKGGEVVGRMYQVSPRNAELYALRLLLMHSCGADLMKNDPLEKK